MIHEGTHRLARGVEDAHGVAIVQTLHRTHLARYCVCNEVEEIIGAVGEVGMRVFFVEDQGVGVAHLFLGEMTVQIQLGAEGHVRPDHGAYRFEEIALGVGAVDAVGLGDGSIEAFHHHGAVNSEQHGVYGHGGA